MCTVLLPPGVNPTAVKYSISYQQNIKHTHTHTHMRARTCAHTHIHTVLLVMVCNGTAYWYLHWWKCNR